MTSSPADQNDVAPTIRQRHRARVLAFQSLYESDVTGHRPLAVLQRLFDELHAQPVAFAYAQQLVTGVVEHHAAIDQRIRRFATALPFEQMAAIDRSLLRLAIFEALYNSTTIPVGVAIDEAVELAKRYGSESSSRFVNGVLGRVVSDRTPDATIVKAAIVKTEAGPGENDEAFPADGPTNA